MAKASSRRAPTIDATSRDVTTTKNQPTPLDNMREQDLNRVNIDKLANIIERTVRGEAMCQLAEIRFAIDEIDQALMKAGKKRGDTFDKSIMVAQLEGERTALEKMMRAIIARHFPCGVI